MNSQWVIADIHGCAKSLIQLIEEKICPNREDEIYLLGDYIDRGPDSKGVIDYILDLKDQSYSIFPLKGNHEDVMVRCHAHEQESQSPIGLYPLKDSWLYFGGRATLKSFGVKNLREVPRYYIEFMDSLPYYYALDNFVLSHAGLNFALEDPFSDLISMLWIKDCPVEIEKIQNRRLIHGHVAYPLQEIQRQIAESPVIGLDNGCVYQKPGMHHLLALELNSLELKIQKNIESSAGNSSSQLTVAA